MIIINTLEQLKSLWKIIEKAQQANISFVGIYKDGTANPVNDPNMLNFDSIQDKAERERREARAVELFNSYDYKINVAMSKKDIEHQIGAITDTLLTCKGHEDEGETSGL